MVQRHRVNDRNFRVIEGGKRDWDIPTALNRPALPPEPRVDWFAVFYFAMFVGSIAAIMLMLHFKANP